MINDNQHTPEITIQPIISYPREAEVGKTYLMTVDVQSVFHAEAEENEVKEDKWLYAAEEYTLYCLLDTDLFTYEENGEPVIILNRFGGTYGPASFHLTANNKPQTGQIGIKFINEQGVLVSSIELPNITVWEHSLVSLSHTVFYKFPYPIAIRYERMLREKSFESKTRLAIYVYESLIRFLVLIMLSEYLNEDPSNFNDTKLNREIAKLIDRPASLGTWVNLFFVFLKAYHGQQERLFLTPLYDFYWDTSIVPNISRKGIKSTFFQLVELRNDFYHSLPSTHRAWRTLYKELVKNLNIILSKLSFIAEYKLIYITGVDVDKFQYETHFGHKVKQTSSTFLNAVPIEIDSCYLIHDNKFSVSLSPYLIYWKDELVSDPFDQEIVLFDSFRSQRLEYWHTAGRIEVTDKEIVATFIENVVERIQGRQNRRKISHLSWEGLKDLSYQITLQQLGDSRTKYDPRLYIQRQETRKIFDEFLQSDKSCLILTGSSGIGKSSFLLSLIDEFQESEKVCLLAYNGGRLDPSVSIEDLVAQDFNHYLDLQEQKLPDGPSTLKMIDSLVDMKDQQILLFVDAINENLDSKRLLWRIDRFVENYPYPWLKVIISSRPESWRMNKRGIPLAEHRYFRQHGKDELGVEITSFHDELPNAYNKYRKFYNLTTAFEDIPKALKQPLREPLILSFVAEVYQGRELPQEIQPNELAKTYVNKLVQTNRLAIEDINFLEREIVHRLVSRNTNFLSFTELEDAITLDGHPLYELIFNNDILSSGRRINQSFVNLVDSEILKLLDYADLTLAFKYEFIYEYFIELYLMNRESSDQGKNIERREKGNSIFNILSRLFGRDDKEE